MKACIACVTNLTWLVSGEEGSNPVTLTSTSCPLLEISIALKRERLRSNYFPFTANNYHGKYPFPSLGKIFGK